MFQKQPMLRFYSNFVCLINLYKNIFTFSAKAYNIRIELYIILCSHVWKNEPKNFDTIASKEKIDLFVNQCMVLGCCLGKVSIATTFEMRVQEFKAHDPKSYIGI
jgi:hypothetical protein